MTASHARNTFVINNFNSHSSQSSHQPAKIPTPQCRVRFLRRPEFRFHSQVYLNFAAAKPNAASLGEFGWLGNLGHTHKVYIKMPRRLLTTHRHGQLNMIDRQERE